jgi:hypothetical protein
MRRSLGYLALGIFALCPAAVLYADGNAKDPLGGTCETHGTSVHFHKTPTEAAKQAAKDEKLVLVLHISGIFEDTSLT